LENCLTATASIEADLASQQAMDFTGERMVPEFADPSTLWEHIYRYKFASRYVDGKAVLDIACGEGYGTKALICSGAASVVGVDISEEACRHARRKYGVDARVGDATAIPLPDRTIDVVVSFETIEHVAEPSIFLKECLRVLKSPGCLIISTPNVEAYNPDRTQEHNPFHCSEMSETEFTRLLDKFIVKRTMYTQCLERTSAWYLRSVAMKNSPWRNMRGYWRLQSRFSPVRPEDERAARRDPVAAILKKDTWLQTITNPYGIWVRNPRSRESAKYFICVGRV
jgi:ubiquinone/menaquinone biosynthesis C-methylase UbiE